MTDSKISDDKIDLRFAYRFHNTMQKNGLMLAYEGEVTQQLTKAFSSLAESNLEKEEEAASVRRKVFHIMVECLQNVAKHSDDLEGQSSNPGSGIFLVGRMEDYYAITTGNIINNDRIEEVESLILQVNEMERDEVKEFYKKVLKESRLSDKKGAGLGFIDMVKKTGSKIHYHFEPINDKTSYFLYKVKIFRTS